MPHEHLAIQVSGWHFQRATPTPKIVELEPIRIYSAEGMKQYPSETASFTFTEEYIPKKLLLQLEQRMYRNLITVLNELSRNGWEVVASIPQGANGESFRLILKLEHN